MGWLFGGSTLAKIVLFLIAALGALGAVMAAKAVYDRNRRREGAREVIDQINEQGRKRQEDMRNAPKPQTDQDVDDILRGGRA